MVMKTEAWSDTLPEPNSKQKPLKINGWKIKLHEITLPETNSSFTPENGWLED